MYYRCATIGYVPHTEMRTIFFLGFFHPSLKYQMGLPLMILQMLALWSSEKSCLAFQSLYVVQSNLDLQFLCEKILDTY